MLSGAGCKEHKWEKYENQLSAGALQYNDAKTVEQCQEFCVANLDCVAVDVNVMHDPPTCWPHFSMDQLRDDNVYNHSGVNQYRLVQRCTAGTDAPSGIGIFLNSTQLNSIQV